MDPRISIVTLGVANLSRAVAFYRDVLRFPLAGSPPDEIAFFRLTSLVLALYPRWLLAEDAALVDGGELPPRRFGGFTLAYNVRTREEVDTVLSEVVAGGAMLLKPAHDATWGGRSGYFADPDGHAWEVAWNPMFPLDEDGIVQLPM